MSEFLGCLRGTADPTAKRSVRWTMFAAGLAATLMALDAMHPLAVRCAEALACLKTDFTGRKRVGKTYNGLMKALSRQSWHSVPRVKKELRTHAARAFASIRKTAGWTLLAVDGSKEDLPRTANLEGFFGFGHNGKVPQSFTTAIVEVHTGVLWDWRIGKAAASEKHHLIQMAAELPAGALLLADGNFVGYPIWSTLHEGGHHFLIRVGGNASLITGLFPGSRAERRGDIVYVWTKNQRTGRVPLRLRLIRLGSDSNPVYLLTNVLDHRLLSKRAAGAIYRKRWGVELFYRMFKRTMGFAKLRTRTGKRAEIELEWSLVAAAIVALLGIGELRKRRIDPRRLSPAALLRALREVLVRGDLGSRVRHAGRRLSRALGRAVRDQYTRHAPKHSRHRPITKNTPDPLKLKPPKVRDATDAERADARRRFADMVA